MGGRLDATNIIQNTLVAVFASISLDHMRFLGNTLAEIARKRPVSSSQAARGQ